MLNSRFIDFFTYFASWEVHHQLDYGLARFIDCNVNHYESRFFTFIDGEFPCAIDRSFTPSKNNQVCESCNDIAKDRTKNYLLARPIPDYDLIKQRILKNGISNDVIDLVETSLWFTRSDKEIKKAFYFFISNISHLSELTSLTHFRISRYDLHNSNLQDYFISTLFIEAIKILYNWSIQLPESVIIFNGRLCPYSTAYYLAEVLEIPIYVHERGINKSFSIYFHCLPSAGRSHLDLYEKLKLNKFSFRSVSDINLAHMLRTKYESLSIPKNYPNLFNDTQKKQALEQKSKETIYTYIVSSEDEADSEPGVNHGLVQRNTITALVKIFSSTPELRLIIKSHPNIYGTKGYPGMYHTEKFMNSVEEEAKKYNNISFFGKNSDIDPFELVQKSDIIIGLHSSLLDYAWYLGKKIVCLPNSTSSFLATCNIAGFEVKSIIDELKHKLFDGKCLSNKPDLGEALKIFLVSHEAFDINIDPISIGKDNFFAPVNSVSYICDEITKTQTNDFKLLVKAIVGGEDINILLVEERLSDSNRFS